MSISLANGTWTIRGTVQAQSTPVYLPFQFLQCFILIRVNSSNIQEDWYLSGWIHRFVDSGTQPDLDVLPPYQLPLHRASLLEFKPLGVPYNLRFEPVDYLPKAIILDIYEFTPELDLVPVEYVPLLYP